MDYNIFENFERTRLLAGDSMMKALADTRVLIFGVGGVGSWCAESLARTGIGSITMVDPDTVAQSNINRQLPATTATVGLPKVEVLADRLASINPEARIEGVAGRYTPENAAGFGIESYDYVIDAIDSLTDKADLILRCTDPATAPRRAFFSSMGAARKLDPSMISTAEFWKVDGCPLARALRTRFRRSGIFPRRKFRCVYSPESLPHRAEGPSGVNGTFAHNGDFRTHLSIACNTRHICRLPSAGYCPDRQSAVILQQKFTELFAITPARRPRAAGAGFLVNGL